MIAARERRHRARTVDEVLDDVAALANTLLEKTDELRQILADQHSAEGDDRDTSGPATGSRGPRIS